MITKEQFFALKPEIREVPIPALGGSVYVKAMTCGVRDRFEVYQATSGTSDFRALLAAATVCDESGTLQFSLDDVGALTNLPSHALDAVVRAAIDINNLGAVDIEDLKKN